MLSKSVEIKTTRFNFKQVAQTINKNTKSLLNSDFFIYIPIRYIEIQKSIKKVLAKKNVKKDIAFSKFLNKFTLLG